MKLGQPGNKYYLYLTYRVFCWDCGPFNMQIDGSHGYFSLTWHWLPTDYYIMFFLKHNFTIFGYHKLSRCADMVTEAYTPTETKLYWEIK